MKVKLPYGTALLILLIITFFSGLAEAVSIKSFGRPVISIMSDVSAVPDCPATEGDSCFNTSTGYISYYIPLSEDASGIFGVDKWGTPPTKTAGTESDEGGGFSNSLTMFLRFDPVAMPAASASLAFSFKDLDLIGVNDPNHFFETVQFFNENGGSISSEITMNGQTHAPGELEFVVAGTDIYQTITFPDITSILADPFYAELRFGSSYRYTGRNTPEYLSAVLTSVAVPEPSSLLLLGSGLLGLIVFRKKLTA